MFQIYIVLTQVCVKFSNCDERTNKERGNMKYHQFLCAVEKELNKLLNKEVEISVYTAEKNNGGLKKGILLQNKSTGVSPVIYLEHLHSRFEQGEKMENLISEIIEFYRLTGKSKICEGSKFPEFEEIKEKIVFKIVHTAKNLKCLEDIPKIEILDLSIVFFILLETKGHETATMVICNEHLRIWGISNEELYRTASLNLSTRLPSEFFTMEYAIKEMLDEGTEEKENLLHGADTGHKDDMYVLTNTLRCYGASSIFYPHVLEMVGEMLQEDFFILPSSIHEVIIVPESRGVDENEMDQIIRNINETQVAPEEVLSDHTYFYDRKCKELMNRKTESGSGYTLN
jgi:hypothetical protein